MQLDAQAIDILHQRHAGMLAEAARKGAGALPGDCRQIGFMQRTPRWVATRTPGDLGLAFEPVELWPADAAIRLHGWLVPAASSKATIVFVHGGGEDNRTLPYGDGLELVEWIQREKQHGLEGVFTFSRPARWTAYAAICTIMIMFAPDSNDTFIYFQF